MKNSYPVQVADYAVANHIDDEPAFAWWVPTEVKLCMGRSYFMVQWTCIGQIKGKLQDFTLTTRSGQRDLYTDNPFPEKMRLVYWLKVNSSMTIITDHLWCIPFCDQRFQCNLLSYIIAFCVWTWFLVRAGEMRESLQDTSHVTPLSHPSITIGLP